MEFLAKSPVGLVARDAVKLDDKVPVELIAKGPVKLDSRALVQF